MANKLDPMDLKQLLSLHQDGLSNRQIGELLSISRNTVNNYIKLAKASDYSPDELLAMDQPALGELFTAHTTLINDRFDELMGWFELMNHQRNHPGFTFIYHYQEYCRQVSNPYSYTQFMEHYHRKYDHVKGSMKLPGKKFISILPGRNCTWPINKPGSLSRWKFLWLFFQTANILMSKPA